MGWLHGLDMAHMHAGAKKGGGKQKLSWLDALRHKSEQSKQRRKPEATPSQIAGMWTLSPFWLAICMGPITLISPDQACLP